MNVVQFQETGAAEFVAFISDLQHKTGLIFMRGRTPVRLDLVCYIKWGRRNAAIFDLPGSNMLPVVGMDRYTRKETVIDWIDRTRLAYLVTGRSLFRTMPDLPSLKPAA